MKCATHLTTASCFIATSVASASGTTWRNTHAQVEEKGTIRNSKSSNYKAFQMYNEQSLDSF